jgi:type II secretory pathway pseudopilin PulG
MRVVGLAAAAAAGYLLGTKAGRERYEQILAAAAAASRRLEAYGNGGRFAAGGSGGDSAEGAGTKSR